MVNNICIERVENCKHHLLFNIIGCCHRCAKPGSSGHAHVTICQQVSSAALDQTTLYAVNKVTDGKMDSAAFMLECVSKQSIAHSIINHPKGNDHV